MLMLRMLASITVELAPPPHAAPPVLVILNGSHFTLTASPDARIANFAIVTLVPPRAMLPVGVLGSRDDVMTPWRTRTEGAVPEGVPPEILVLYCVSVRTQSNGRNISSLKLRNGVPKTSAKTSIWCEPVESTGAFADRSKNALMW